MAHEMMGLPTQSATPLSPVYTELSLIATVIVGVRAIKLAEIPINRALEREIPDQPFSRLCVVGLMMVSGGMILSQWVLDEAR